MTLDWNAIILALIAGSVTGIPATIIAWRSSRQVNGHLAKFTEAAVGRAAAEATVIANEAERARQVEALRVAKEHSLERTALLNPKDRPL